MDRVSSLSALSFPPEEGSGGRRAMALSSRVRCALKQTTLAGARIMSSQAAAKPLAALGVVFGRSAVMVPDWSAFAAVERTHALAEGTLRDLYKNPTSAVRRVLSGEPVQGVGVLLGQEVRSTGQKLRDDAGYQAGPWEDSLAQALGAMLSKVRRQKRTEVESPFYSKGISF